MPLYPGFNICTFTAHFNQPTKGVAWSNTSYWEAASTNLTSANVVAGCDAFMVALGAVMAPIMHEDYQLFAVTARIFISGGVVDGASTHAVIGGSKNSENAMPMNSSVVIQKRTSSFGRSARGRYFIGGLAEDSNEGGLIANSDLSLFKAVATFYGADRTFSVPFHARHWDKKNNVFLAIQACYAIDKISTMRSRTKKIKGAIIT